MWLLKKIFQRIQRMHEVSKYNDFTIADYLRKKGALIGEDNRIEIRSLGSEPFLIKIGNHCTIAPGVEFLTHDGATWIFTDEFPSLQKFGRIVIEDNCFIGSNVIVMGGVSIGPNSVVGAGTVVTKDVPPSVVVVGNPAREVSSIEEYKKKVLVNWKVQKPPGYFNDLSDGVRYSPQHIHNIKQRDFMILKDHLEKIFESI